MKTAKFKNSSNAQTLAKAPLNAHKKLELICLAGLLAALCFVLTAYLHIPTNNGITHVGDGIIFLAAALLPTPYAIGAAVVGATLADILSGFPVWAPATIVIKAATVLLFTSKKEKLLNLRNITALPFAYVVCAAGYTAYEALVITDLKTALVALPSYAVQIGASSALFILLAVALDRVNFKAKI